jgi:dephospho-CoA kinase
MSIRIGLTGGIGSGKSVVSRLLAVMGVPVYNCDDEAKRLTATDIKIRNELSALVGDGLYVDGVMQKERLATYLFASADNVLRVNAVIHPAVKHDFLQWVERRVDSTIVGIESAILYEAGFTDVVDRVVMVYAPMETRVERAMKRDGASRERIEERIRMQMDDEEKCRQADFVIVNDGRQALIPQLLTLVEELKKQ